MNILNKVFLVTATLLIPWSCYAKPDQPYAIATAHPLASKAGVEILEQGGNAFDAAVAITAALAVVEPMSSGLGGGGFWLLHDRKNARSVMLDGREKAPLKAHRDLYLDPDGNVDGNKSITGALAAGIPGTPAAITHIAGKYGRLPLTVSLRPAIRYARNGFTVDEQYQLYSILRLNALRSDAEAAGIFLQNGEVPAEGFVLKQPDLADTLEMIARKGDQAFYQGDIAKKLVQGVRKAGGIWTPDDLAKYSVKERKPVIFEYQDLEIITASLPSSGGLVLKQILGTYEQYHPDTIQDDTLKKHLLIEIMKRAYADRAQYLGDPDFISVPVKKITSEKYLSNWVSQIRRDQATPSERIAIKKKPSGNGSDTTHFSVIDGHGNIVSATMSINYPFGACIVAPGTGVLLNDEMDDFSAKPGVPNAYGLIGGTANAIEPGKRPLSSMTPTIVYSPDRIAALGTPGGSRIITMVLLGILAFEQGADASTIVSKARYHHQYLPDQVTYEDEAFSEDEIKALQAKGHQLKPKMSPYGGGFGSYGNMHIVIKNRHTDALSAASDPRGIGSAMTEQPK